MAVRWDLAVGGWCRPENWDGGGELAERSASSVSSCGAERGPPYDDADVSELARVWTVSWDGPVTFDDGEVVAAEWVPLDELGRLLGRRSFVADSVALVWPLIDST